MYDLHNHLLPRLDDGPNNMDETLMMVKMSSEQGVKVIVATPHRKDVNQFHSIEEVQEILANVRELSLREGCQTEIMLGMENHLDRSLISDVRNGRALPINDGKYILVEMPYEKCDANALRKTLHSIQKLRLIPVIAHPERMELFHSDPNLLSTLVEEGMLTQITAGSLSGKFGGKVRRFTMEMLNCNLAHVISSDAHDATGDRSPDMSTGYNVVRGIVGTVVAQGMVRDIPLSILENSDVAVDSPKRFRTTKAWWRF